VKRSIKTMLESCIDYAGLFPPASLDMESSVRNYAHYQREAYNWALGRFILPVSRLEEFNFCVEDLGLRGDDFPIWRLSVLANENVKDTVERSARFNTWHADRSEAPVAAIDTLEVKTPSREIIGRVADQVPDSLTLFCEVPLDTFLDEALAEVAHVGACAKARTGGVRPELIPGVSNVARFLSACRNAAVPFKLTAGLHHPLRSERELTYEPDGPVGMMHGYVNVLLAAAFAFNGADVTTLVDVLSDETLDDFRFEENTVSWREHRMTAEALAKARLEFVLSFGSCSFEEPFDDLKGLNLI
jgi:hypothetical protein